MKVRFEISKQDDTLMTEEEFYAKIDWAKQQAREGKVQILTKEKQKDLLGPMSYDIQYIRDAEKDLEKHKKALQKIDALLNELREHPKTGTEKPEQLETLHRTYLVTQNFGRT